LRDHCLRALAFGSLALASLTALRAATVQGRVVVFNAAGKQMQKPQPPVVFWLNPLSAQPDSSGAVQGKEVRKRFRLVQKDKRFEPHVLIVPVGSAVDFPNQDPFFHNVFSLYDGKRFDLGLYEAGSTRKVIFDRPGICYIFCNIHSEMSAVVVVVATPFYGVSDSEGRLLVSDVPAGRYELRLWHERSLPDALSNLAREVTVSEGATSLGTIRVTESGELVQTHKNIYGRDYDPSEAANPIYKH
jgi:plastocyanin